MKKRWTAALLAFALAVCLLPAPAQAAGVKDTAGSRLTGVERVVYDYMKAELVKIAQGSRTSTEIRIPDQSSLSWPLSELGSNAGSAVEEKVNEVLDIRRVFKCLSVDCPYEMFWRSDRFTWGYSLSRGGGKVTVRDLTVRIEVAQDYRGVGSTRTSQAKIIEANKALETAQAIVAQYQGLSDMDKLAAYRKEICRLTNYNTNAAKGNMPYGDPWQMIYVFDGDPETNVVCEGYAKAFKHLCDLSDFQGSVACYLVSGTMDSGSHMWNVVRMGDGKNYLVDVTNCDTGTVGAEDKLFLTGGTSSADGRTYTVSKDRLQSVYTYDEDQAGLYADGYLALNGTDYVPGFDLPPEPAAVPAAGDGAFADVPAAAYYADPVAWAVEEEITNGTTETTFSPGDLCTHGQILTFLWRAAGEPGDPALLLGDVEYYAGAVRWASELKMLGEEFDPEAGCSRADAVRYIWLAFEGPDAQVASFTDVPVDSPYAHAVGWALLEGVTTGASETTFEPDTICDRGQIVTFLYRAYH